MEGDWHISKDMYINEDKSNGSNDEVGESGKDDPNNN